ncbi:MAG TPA: DsrE family protein [Pyrinomonadaceae bacterium]
MATYIFIETRDPFESRDTRFIEETAAALKNRRNNVTIFLMQNGVLACRRKADDPYVSRLLKAGVALLADDFSLSERGIRSDELHEGVRSASVDELVDALVQADTKAVWH